MFFKLILFYILFNLSFVFITPQNSQEYRRPRILHLPDEIKPPSHLTNFTNVTILRVFGLLFLCVNIVVINSLYVQLRFVFLHDDELNQIAINDIEQQGTVTYITRAEHKRPVHPVRVPKAQEIADVPVLTTSVAMPILEKTCETQASQMTVPIQRNSKKKSRKSLIHKMVHGGGEDVKTAMLLVKEEKSNKDKEEKADKTKKAVNKTTKEKKNTKDKKSDVEAKLAANQSVRLPRAQKGHHENELKVMEDMLLDDEKTEIG